MATKKTDTTGSAKPKTAETNPDTSAVGINNADTTSADTATDTDTSTNTDAGTDKTELPATVKIKFNKNVRYNRTSYVKDDVAEVSVVDYEQMIEHCEIVESAE